MIAKRGVQLCAIHYHSFPFTSEQAKQKVIDLAKQIAAYAGPIRLYVVPFTELQQELYQKCPDSLMCCLPCSCAAACCALPNWWPTRARWKL